MFLCLLLTGPIRAGEISWHHPLYLGRGGVWSARIPVAIENRSGDALEGHHVTLRIGVGEGAAGLAGQRSEALRVVDPEGREMLFALHDPDQKPVEKGPIPEGAYLTLPVDCPAGDRVVYHVYFANPDAWGVPDFLTGVSPGGLNGGFEKGTGGFPAGWTVKDTSEKHRVEWDAAAAHGGKKCVRVTVDKDAESNWVGAVCGRQTLIPGARYEVRAWVKGEGVKGTSGWFLHAGNRGEPMLIHRLENAGSGTFDWKQVTMTFTASEGATGMIVGTVLRGTGTAWFDDLTIECDSEPEVTVSVGAAERIELEQSGGVGDFAEGESAPAWWLPVHLVNLTGNRIDNALAAVSLGTSAPLHHRIEPAGLRGGKGEAGLPFFRIGESVFFPCELTPRSRQDFGLYFREKEGAKSAEAVGRQLAGIPSDYAVDFAGTASDLEAYRKLLASPANLVRNPDFVQSGDGSLPDAWTGAPAKPSLEAGEYSLAEGGLFGERCARLRVLPEAKESWRGWKQRAPVKPGRTYLMAVWARCENLKGSAALHAHLLQAAGGHVTEDAFRGAGAAISGDTGWTLWQGLVRTPADAGFLELHLTTNTSGVLWHDGALVAEVLEADAGALEARRTVKGIVMTQVNAIEKVFREEIRETASERLEASLARNESEAVQVAVSSGDRREGLRIEVAEPVSKAGGKLAVDVNVVGYVPVDYPTNYYRSETPPWHRKFPTAGPRCDGWPGWWPDPLLPTAKLDLEPGRPQPVWLTVNAPGDAAPGAYHGEVRLISGEKEVLAKLPLEITVWDFALPAESSLAAIYDVRLSQDWLEGKEDPEEVRSRMLRFMADRRISADRVRVDPKFEVAEGKITADFTEYDREAAAYFDELKFPRAYTPPFFYCFGWGHPPKKILGEDPYPGAYPYEDADRAQLRPEYKKAYQTCLKLYWDHMKEKGWADRTVLYISDEPHFTHEHIVKQMQALCDMIHEVDPAIPIYSSTWRHCPEWDGYLDVWGVGHYGCFDVEKMKERRAAGDRIWFTTDGQMCTDTPYCAVERLLPHYCFQYDAEAYEFWGVSWLTWDPYDFGWHRYIHQSSEPGREYYVRYPNGDGFLLYPGGRYGQDDPVSSVRFEQAREGVEDYEYLRLLRGLLEKAPADHPGRAGGERALQNAAALVEIPNAGGRYSSQILPDPARVLAVRKEVAEAILGLRKDG